MKEIKLTDIKGVKVGQYENQEAATGCSVVIVENGATAGVDVRGGGPATRETDLLNPINMVQQIHAVMLSVGAFGLDQFLCHANILPNLLFFYDHSFLTRASHRLELPSLKIGGKYLCKAR